MKKIFFTEILSLSDYTSMYFKPTLFLCVYCLFLVLLRL